VQKYDYFSRIHAKKTFFFIFYVKKGKRKDDKAFIYAKIMQIRAILAIKVLPLQL